MTKKITVVDINDLDPHLVIPQGAYCYAPTGKSVIKDHVIGNNGQKMKVKPYSMPEFRYCPFFSLNKEDERYCLHIKSNDGLIDDSVKECGINEGNNNG
jgi:hypothetical protein